MRGFFLISRWKSSLTPAIEGVIEGYIGVFLAKATVVFHFYLHPGVQDSYKH